LTKKGKNRILLTQKKEVRPPSKTGQRLDKIPGRDPASLKQSFKSLQGGDSVQEQEIMD